MKIELIVDSFTFILKKTFPSMIFREKRFRFTLFLLTNSYVKKSEIFRKIPEIVDDHDNFGTEYVTDMKLVSKCVVLDTLLYSLITQFRPKVDLGPFEMSSSKCEACCAMRDCVFLT